jgi:DNA-directed RNA polymerase subunit RPC12/RpoP
MSQKDKDFHRFYKHFPKTIGKNIRDYVTNHVLKGSRYIFIRRVKGIQFGYCTHCNERFMTPFPLKHNEMTDCPKCGSRCEVKNHGTSRKYMVDNAFVVYYEKSRVNPDAIIARAFRVFRDYRGDYTRVETEYSNTALYLFEPSNAEMYEHYWWHKEDKYVKCASVHSLELKSQYANNQCSEESIKKAIEGTPYQYSTWDQHDQPQWDYVKFFALYSKYPAVEYLTKLGFKYFVGAKLFDLKTFNCINWTGKNINSILRLNKSEIKEVLQYGTQVNPIQLRLYQLSRKDSNRPSLCQIIETFKGAGDVMNEIKHIMKYANVGKIINYMKKQINRPEKRKYRKYQDILTAWRDYLVECETLEFDMSNERIIFPSNLFASHQKTMKMVVHKQNEETDRKIKSRQKQLSRYVFEDANLIIRPAQSTFELINEGKELSICVGTYAGRYAKGDTVILLVRKKLEPDKPFYTVEVWNDEVRQVQGLKHCSPTSEVREFMEKFKKAKLAKSDKKVGIAV